ncbi:MAG: 5-oxoprolinase [Planctomycetaceae bacterium]|nr:MAG: 5-oxoprolinase [Planctomycetaceae bacterium]
MSEVELRETRPRFWIDVGGTFTDGVVVFPDGAHRVLKVLSSGVLPAQDWKGLQEHTSDTATAFHSAAWECMVDNMWVGYQLRARNADGCPCWETPVVRSWADGTVLGAQPQSLADAVRLELTSGEEAPLVLIRKALGLPLQAKIPPVRVRLGTTRGTNALLTRTGARVGLLVTRGFRDVLRIGSQERPHLFELTIRKPEPLFHAVEEIDERISATGEVLQPLHGQSAREAVQRLRQAGCESLAIVLMHAWIQPEHERLLAELAREAGFEDISLSSEVSATIKLVPRGETTVLDAYLNPVLRQYLEKLRAALPGSDLRLMTSSGSLVSADRFSGRESVLSGPAGGVWSCACLSRASATLVAERAIERGSCDSSERLSVIGFDMGGTSTDVSRYAGEFVYETEAVKAGVRIVTPLLAIETVAAGGGSICDFDGVKLCVGPHSAGADPGPACYGRGGPLTITDCQVYLGRILPDKFPFPLDQRAIQHRLSELAQRVAASPMGREYSLEELAAGFLEIADAAMARAIRRVSVAKGYNPSRDILLPFGGAGALHACGVARQLNMQRILIPPLAGVLSAVGMGLADIRRVREQSCIATWDESAWVACQPLLREMSEALREEVLAEGVPPAQIAPPFKWLGLRYRGTESLVFVPAGEPAQVAAAYAARHRDLFGYERSGHPLELARLRVEVVGQSGEQWPPLRRAEPAASPQPITTQHRVWFAGQPWQTAVYDGQTLPPGCELRGPALVLMPTFTAVIAPGFRGTVLRGGELWLEDVEAEERTLASRKTPPAGRTGSAQQITESVDPVQLELFHHAFASIAEQMGHTLRNTALSTNVKERLDFSCALFDAQGGLVVNAPHIPVHLGAMSETVRCVLRDHPDLAPGDVIITNDPFRGGSHLPDVTVVTPVFDQSGRRLLFFTASRAHHAEIGGITPGSMPPFSRHLGEEGVLIRSVKWLDRGRSREAELEQLLRSGLYPSRAVADNLADLRAQVAANQRGVMLLQELMRQQGEELVLAYMKHLQAAAAAAMRRALASLPSGEYRFVDHLDDGTPIAVTITLHHETARIDFSGTGPVGAHNLNANRAIVTSAVLYSLRCLIGVCAQREQGSQSAVAQARVDASLPLNGGLLEPIDLILPECLLNPPEHPDPRCCAAMVGGNVETSQRVVDVLLGALGLAAASQGTMNNLTLGDESFGYYETICGGAGATANGPGADAVHTHMTNTRLTDPEILEHRYPLRLLEFAIRRTPGGAGRFAGGRGVVRRIQFLRSLQVSLLTERRGPYPPYGMQGGQPGPLGRNTLYKSSGEVLDLGGKASFRAEPGDVLTICTPGGGGFGSPTDAP